MIETPEEYAPLYEVEKGSELSTYELLQLKYEAEEDEYISSKYRSRRYRDDCE